MRRLVAKFGNWCGVDGEFAAWFVTIGILLQLITGYVMNDTAMAVCSGIAGTISVVLCSQRKYNFYFWSILQLVTLIVISFQSGLFGKVLENGFYLLTLIIGMFIWNSKTSNGKVKPEKMGLDDHAILWIFLPLLTFGISTFVTKFNGTNQVILDTLTTVIGIVAQIMMIFRFREQWILWFILDVLCVVLWAIDGNWCISMQYVFWTVNCIYGFMCWKPNLSEYPEQSTTN